MFTGWSDRPLFTDRRAAGLALARALDSYRGQADVVVLGLPRGGVPIAHALASELGVAMDVFVVRKLGVPGHEELAFGAIASGGRRVLSDEVIGDLGLTASAIEQVTRREQAELDRREDFYRPRGEAMALAGRTAIIVDDGLATGSTMRAAIAAVRAANPARLIVAVPVAPQDTCRQLRPEADEVVCLETPEPFYAVGMWYEDFRPTTDDEVVQLVADAAALDRSAPEQHVEEVRLGAGEAELNGDLVLPERARGIVLFAHGSGSSRLSPRNRYVAGELQAAGLATLLIDLLTPEEDELDQRTRELRFDVPLLAARLSACARWLAESERTTELALGLFGASTGAAAALVAAADDERVRAVVSRGGRPDLAADALGRVRAPVLLVVGERDEQVIDLNREAQAQLRCDNELVIVPGATHLFEEPGTLDEVARLGREWFLRWLA